MNKRERLLAVLEGKKPDVVPYYADLSWWYGSHYEELPDKYKNRDGYLKFHVDTNTGIYLYPSTLWTEKHDDSVKLTTEKNSNLTKSIFITPVGKIQSVSQYLPESHTSAYVEQYVKNINDLKTMQYLFEHTVYSPSYDGFINDDAFWNGHGFPCALAPVCNSPIQKLLTRWAGPETTVNLWVDNTDEFEQQLYAIAESEKPVFDIICNSPAKLVCLPENLSSEITGRIFYEKYSFPIYKDRIERLHKAGKYALLHIDGTLKGLLPMLSKTGLDGAESVTPEPSGDIPVEELRKYAGDNLIIWGGLPGALFSPNFSETYFADFVKRVLDVFSNDYRFVLASADQVPPDAEFKRICMVGELVERYGRKQLTP